MKSWGVTVQMKDTEHYFPEVLFIIIYWSFTIPRFIRHYKQKEGVCKTQNPPGTYRNHLESPGTHPEPSRNLPEPPGTLPEPAGTTRNLTGITRNLDRKSK